MTETSPFMPGRRTPLSFETDISTGKFVTDCTTTACGSTFSTRPVKVRWGKASTVTVAAWPGFTLPTSVSATMARSRTLLKSAILRSVVPPLADDVAEEMTWPLETGCSRTVPEIGARTVASSRRCRASSRSVWAFTSCASALA